MCCLNRGQMFVWSITGGENLFTIKSGQGCIKQFTSLTILFTGDFLGALHFCGIKETIKRVNGNNTATEVD